MSDRAIVEAVGIFMGAPASRDLAASTAAVLGLPFDCGFHPTRIGARLGLGSIHDLAGTLMHKCLQLAGAGWERARPSQLAG